MRIILSILFLFFFQAVSLLSAQEKESGHVRQQVVKQNTTPSSVGITSSGNRVIVSNAPVGSKLEIYSVVGVKVQEREMKQAFGEYEMNIAKGYYIIRIGDTVRKIAIR
ncbi:hypothetical protein Barb6_00945 [Bacteroidales bacterium Barb6]|nr:hypothetical protein Barb6XT_02113 [Bacteroidales bacterium Barb6XT]OAV67896.1 hypothetical protein Barb6XT_01265 [Bacteroidales bacterium Barb6XT]OAV72642.1 hypothetical protein Barb6_00945 [Bacteroidales bacterium Barb6]